MKSLARLGATLCAVGATVLGTWIATGTRAIALSQAEIVQQLNDIPVFTITDSEGNPFVAVISEPVEEPAASDEAEGEDSATDDSATQTTILTRVFISHEDAETALETFETENPDVDDVQITPISLGLVYQTASQSLSQENRLEFFFVPMIEEVNYALSLFSEEDTPSPGVPLFMVSSADDTTADADVADEDEAITLLTFQNGSQEIIPLFFSREQFNEAIDSIDDEASSFQDNLNVDVIWLRDYIRLLEIKDDEEVRQYRMIPLDDSLGFARSFAESIRTP